MKYPKKEFEQLVINALESLPEHIGAHVRNVAVVVERRPTQEQMEEDGVRRSGILLGLYEGVPETQWGKGLGLVLPDKITIFQESIEHFANTPQEIEREVRNTVWHEVAHYFGYDDEAIDTLEKKRRTSM